MPATFLIVAVAFSLSTPGDSLQSHVERARGPEPVAVLETITVTASQGGDSETSDPIEVHVERTPDGRGRLDVKGYTVFMDDEALEIVHESNDGAFVRVVHSGRPAATVRRIFADVPSAWLSMAFARDTGEDVFAGLIPAVPGLRAVDAGDDADATGYELVAEGASGSFDPALPGSMRLTVDAGQWVPEGGRLEWSWAMRRSEPRGTAFDPGRRRELDHIAALPRAAPAAGAGDTANDLVLPLASGGTFNLTEHEGKVVIIDFWASWCGPCRAALPRLSNFAEGVAERGLPVEIVTVNTSERERDPSKRTAFVLEQRDKIGFDLPVAIDIDGAVATSWGISALPTTVIVAPDGTVASVHRGAGGDYEDMLEAEVQQLIGPKD